MAFLTIYEATENDRKCLKYTLFNQSAFNSPKRTQCFTASFTILFTQINTCCETIYDGWALE